MSKALPPFSPCSLSLSSSPRLREFDGKRERSTRLPKKKQAAQAAVPEANCGVGKERESKKKSESEKGRGKGSIEKRSTSDAKIDSLFFLSFSVGFVSAPFSPFLGLRARAVLYCSERYTCSFSSLELLVSRGSQRGRLGACFEFRRVFFQCRSSNSLLLIFLRRLLRLLRWPTSSSTGSSRACLTAGTTSTRKRRCQGRFQEEEEECSSS